MKEFNYQGIKQVYDMLLANNTVFWSIIGIKALAATLVVITFYFKYLDSLKEDKIDKKRLPISSADLIKAVIIVLCVAGYDYILYFLDGLFGSIENQYISSVTEGSNLNEVAGSTIDSQIQDKSWTDAIKEGMAKLSEFFNDPLIIVLWVIKGLAWITTALAYGVYIAERFFFLGILRILGAFAIACYGIEKLEKWFWNWIGLYAAIYLVIIPYMLVNVFTTEIQNFFTVQLQAIDSNVGINGSSSILGALLIIFLAVLQLKLYRKSSDIVMKIFN